MVAVVGRGEQKLSSRGIKTEAGHGKVGAKNGIGADIERTGHQLEARSDTGILGKELERLGGRS